MEKIKQEIRDFVTRTYWSGQQHPLGDDDSFLEHGVMDSFGILELVSFLQETYSINMGEELSPENLDSISRISIFVADKLQKSGYAVVA